LSAQNDFVEYDIQSKKMNRFLFGLFSASVASGFVLGYVFGKYFQIVKTKPGTKIVSSMFYMYNDFIYIKVNVIKVFFNFLFT
jgi:uncharacterized membrane protein YjjP (DUF1212 family)